MFNEDSLKQRLRTLTSQSGEKITTSVIGPTGAGKSAMVNALLGADVAATHRDLLVLLPSTDEKHAGRNGTTASHDATGRDQPCHRISEAVALCGDLEEGRGVHRVPRAVQARRHNWGGDLQCTTHLPC